MFPLKDDNPIFHRPYVTMLLIAINLLVWLWMSTRSPLDEQLEVIEHGFIPERIAQLRDPELVVKVPIVAETARIERWPGRQQPQAVQVVQLSAAPTQILSTLLTSMFMHGGWMHVLGNMWFLWIFGDNIEDRLGPLLYLAFYLLGGLIAVACHWAYNPHSAVPVVGASGAVATILGAYAVTFPRSRVRTLLMFGVITVVDFPALVWLAFWFFGQLISAFASDDLGVAVWAHIGGFVAGAVLMPLLSFGAPPPGSNWSDEADRHFTFSPPER